MSDNENMDDQYDGSIPFNCTCFADTESDCYCNRVIGIYPAAKADIPIVNISDDEWDEYFSASE